METRNIIAAISLSAAVIILYSLFFAPPPVTKENLTEKTKTEQNSDAPSLDQKENVTEISREEALKQSERIQFENQSIVGSISLKGAAIDDLTFKEYNVSLESDEKVKFLAPRSSKEGYIIESGFITTDKNIDIPNADSIWSVSGNNKLTDQSPIKLSWTNDQGITFEKEIALDDKFLFTIKQRVINSTDKNYDFYSYGQIIRNQIPEGLTDFYILHEGPIATLDEELIEEDYDDIEEKKFSRTAQKGWLGLGDKYYISTLIPPREKEFKTTMDYKNKYRINFVTTEKVNPMSGCLPILIQIPVFFALYKVLFVTIEMRHMPFYGWIQDLSAKDPTSIFNLFGLFPYDVPSFLVIGAWPVAMGVSMWVQQKLNPAPTDPMQAKIFMFFPLFLTVILAPFPSGLVIYWTVNNILTMAQQVVIMKRTTVKTVT